MLDPEDAGFGVIQEYAAEPDVLDARDVRQTGGFPSRNRFFGWSDALVFAAFWIHMIFGGLADGPNKFRLILRFVRILSTSLVTASFPRRLGAARKSAAHPRQLS